MLTIDSEYERQGMDKLRVISSQKDLAEADKNYLRSFIFNQMAAKGFISKAEILQRLKVESAD